MYFFQIPKVLGPGGVNIPLYKAVRVNSKQIYYVTGLQVFLH